MRFKLVIYLLLFPFFTSFSQDVIKVDTVHMEWQSHIGGIVYRMTSYMITNNSDKNYITWVSPIASCNKATDIIHDFFFKVHGDFSLLQFYYEGLLNNQDATIGYTFIKKIKPKETFTYNVICLKNTYRKDLGIVFFSQDVVEKHLRVKLDDSLFYKMDSVIMGQNYLFNQ